MNRLPRELERLTSLRSLNLYGCLQFSDLSPLAGLTSLQSLNLSWCVRLSGDLSQLAGLTSLQSLDLSSCRLSGDLSPLAGLTSLQSLDLSRYAQLRDLSQLAGLTSLQSLNLSKCYRLIGNLSPLAGLTSLQSLNLYWCRQLKGDLSPLKGLISLQSLDLSGCYQSDLSPLAGLTSLRSLNLSGCEQLSDLSPLASRTSLQSLNLSGCEQLSDLSPLAGLTSLQSLNLSYCRGIRRFAPLESLLPTLKELYLFDCNFDDLPPEVCGEEGENVLDKVRAHYQDLKPGQRIDAEVKVLFLGNGGVGKTQLCRRLRHLEFDPSSVPSTHGVELAQTTAELDGFQEPVRLNLWDFGGQDIYHGSHALFLHEQAIFLILWTPELECRTTYQQGALSFRHRPLSYWLDYLRAFAGADASVLIVQSQCDSARDRASHPPVKVDDFFFLRWLEVSAKTGLGLNLVKAALEESVRDCFERRLPPPIGAGRLKVRDRLRQMLKEDQERESAQRQHRMLERAEFDRICDDMGGISDKEALLDFLHYNGVIFYRPALFQSQIILDQNWALEAIYSIFHRDKCFKQLKKLHGRFSREDLALLIWSGYTSEEQNVFLGMMESCGICFRVRELPRVSDGSDENDGEDYEDEWEYIAPELLPEWSDAQEQLLGRLRDDPPNAEASARYAFLHDGILRNYLSKLGEHAKDAAIYWKYGCWFYEQKTSSQVLIQTRWHDREAGTGAGSLRIQAWGQGANELVEILLRELRSLPTGQQPEITGTVRPGVHALFSSSASIESRLIGPKQLETIKLADLIFGIDSSQMKDFFISYTKAEQAWAEWIAWTLEGAGYSTVIQVWDFRPGSNFVLEMQRAATEANRTIAVLSQKYLQSSFTQPEWAAAFAQDPEGKTRKLIPVRIEAYQLTGLLASIVYLDLVGLPENDARAALLGAFSLRNKPASAPAFPGARTPQAPTMSPTQPAFPGTIHATATSTAKILVNLVEGADQSHRLSAAQRLQFMRQLNEVVPQQFNMLLFAVSPPAGLIPPMPAAQGDRTSALLTWAEAPGGCGLSILKELLDAIVNPQ